MERYVKNYTYEVLMNVLKGSTAFLALVLFGTLILIGFVFLFDGSLGKLTTEQRIWCEEYYAAISFEECSDIAGW